MSLRITLRKGCISGGVSLVQGFFIAHREK